MGFWGRNDEKPVQTAAARIQIRGSACGRQSVPGFIVGSSRDTGNRHLIIELKKSTYSRVLVTGVRCSLSSDCPVTIVLSELKIKILWKLPS